MSNKINTAIATYIETKAIELAQKRKTWEQGTYKRSNEELYELLSECLDFHNELKGDTAKCKALNDHLRANNIAFNEGASLATRIVRAVFNSSFQKRAYSYARVITIADDEKSPNESMSEFITKRGGIEELRRSTPNGKTPTQVRKDNIAFAKETLSKIDALVEPFEISAPTRKADDGAEHSLFVAVMRQEADGKYSMVYETSAKSIVNAALEQVGKEQGKKQQLQESEARQSQNAMDSDQAAASAIEQAQAA